MGHGCTVAKGALLAKLANKLVRLLGVPHPAMPNCIVGLVRPIHEYGDAHKVPGDIQSITGEDPNSERFLPVV